MNTGFQGTGIVLLISFLLELCGPGDLEQIVQLLVFHFVVPSCVVVKILSRICEQG